jgi:hypothetical protein
MTHADLELTLRHRHDSIYTADLRLRAADSAADSDLVSDIPTQLAPAELLSSILDTAEYGSRLTEMLFADPRMREGWARVRGFAQGANTTLRVRLRLDATAEELHSLRWETLQDPASSMPLCRSERVIFSRYLDCDDLTRVRIAARPALRALVAVANPADLEDYNLAPVDVAGEVARIRLALGDIPLTVLGSDTGGPPATLNNLVAALREGYSLFYLVCHGSLRKGTSFLWLEQDDGQHDRVAGDDLVQRIADLGQDQRPLVGVLASCQSAGVSHNTGALAALGPRLARAGVAAVIAMQGDVPMKTVERLMPRFFKSLVGDGQIDRALAQARADLPGDQPWWMPVLFMHVRDGRLWAEDRAAPNVRPSAGQGLLALAQLVKTADIRAAVVAFSTDFESACSQIDVLNSYKLLHDLFQQLEDCYDLLYHTGRRLPADESAWEDAERNELELQTLVDEVLRVAGQASFAADEALWMKRIERARTELHTAVENFDAALLKRAIARISEVLGRELSRMNSSLVTAARTLRLVALVQALTTIRDGLADNDLDPAIRGQFEVFADGVVALANLNARLTAAVATHDAFQEVDDELRRIKELIVQDVEELVLAWDDISSMAQRLCAANPVDWAAKLSENGSTLEQALASHEPIRIRRAFLRFHSHASRSFHQVDQDLLMLCTELQKIGRPTEAVLKMLA